MSKELPWPKKPVFPPEFNMNSDHYKAAQLDYERARADAAMERLRVAEKALRTISADAWADEDGIFHPMLRTTRKAFADTALAAIGDLPK